MNNMTVALPVSRFDADLFTALLAVLKKFGPYRNYDCVLMPTEEMRLDAESWKLELQSVFQSVELVAFDLQVVGWPMAPNRHFRRAAEWIANNKPDRPWLWMEPDLLPVKPAWLDALYDEYDRARKPFMGCVVPTRVKRVVGGQVINGQIIGGEVYDDHHGKHMVGAGIYPGTFGSTSVVLQTVDMQASVNLPSIPAFDISLANEVVYNAYATRLIQHNWETRNYREDGGTIVCEQTEKNPNYHRNKPIRPEVVLLHGCKDFSLAQIVVAKNINQFIPHTPLAITKQDEHTTSQSAAQPLVSQHSYVRFKPGSPAPDAPVAAFQADPVPQPGVPQFEVPRSTGQTFTFSDNAPVAAASTTVTSPEPAPERPVMTKSTFQAAQIQRALKEKGKGMKAPELSERTGIPEAQIPSIVAEPGSGLIRHKMGWICLAGAPAEELEPASV